MVSPSVPCDDLGNAGRGGPDAGVATRLPIGQAGAVAERNHGGKVLVNRLIIEGEDGAESVDLHPRLTVIGGMSPPARMAFAQLLAGALHGTERGVHAEVTDDSNRRMVIIRPTVGMPRVVDVEAGADVTAQYRTYDGKIDLLANSYGRSSITRISADDLTTSASRTDAVRTLSAVEQVALWDAADAALQQGPGSKGEAAWHELAGDIDLHWAAERRTEIQAASRLRQHIAALRSLSSSVPDLSDDDAVALAQGIVSQLTAASHDQGLRPPVVLDEPFIDLDPAVVPLLLELLPGLVGSLQVMLLTNDDAIASWARLEALAGELALVEPALANG
jgi:hypothetical protein